MVTNIAAHFHPRVGMWDSAVSGFYDTKHTIIDIDATHYTIAETDGKRVKDVQRRAISGNWPEIDGWTPPATCEAIRRWFAEMGVPVPRLFWEYIKEAK